MKTWEQKYMGLAFHISEWSKDPSTKVGAVITVNNRVKSIGYNGIPERLDDEKYLGSRDVKILCIQHAESNAIDNSTSDISNGSIYTTHLPCPQCAGRIINNRIAKVYIPSLPSQELMERWNMKVSIQMLNEANVELIVVDNF